MSFFFSATTSGAHHFRLFKRLGMLVVKSLHVRVAHVGLPGDARLDPLLLAHGGADVFLHAVEGLPAFFQLLVELVLGRELRLELLDVFVHFLLVDFQIGGTLAQQAVDDDVLQNGAVALLLLLLRQIRGGLAGGREGAGEFLFEFGPFDFDALDHGHGVGQAGVVGLGGGFFVGLGGVFR